MHPTPEHPALLVHVSVHLNGKHAMKRFALLLTLPVLGSLPLWAQPVLKPNGEIQAVEITQTEAARLANSHWNRASNAPCKFEERGRLWLVNRVEHGTLRAWLLGSDMYDMYIDKQTGKLFTFFPIEAHWFIENAPPEPLTAEEAKAAYLKHFGCKPVQFLEPGDRTIEHLQADQKTHGAKSYWRVYHAVPLSILARDVLYIEMQTGEVFTSLPSASKGKKGKKKS